MLVPVCVTLLVLMMEPRAVVELEAVVVGACERRRDPTADLGWRLVLGCQSRSFIVPQGSASPALVDISPK